MRYEDLLSNALKRVDELNQTKIQLEKAINVGEQQSVQIATLKVSTVSDLERIEELEMQVSEWKDLYGHYYEEVQEQAYMVKDYEDRIKSQEKDLRRKDLRLKTFDEIK